MNIPQTAAEVLSHHVTFQLECIDRMYLNVYVPKLQSAKGVANFFRYHLGHRFASSVLMDPISKRFIEGIKALPETEGVEIVPFVKGMRKDDVTAKYLKSFNGEEGILYIGKAQEKAPVFRTEQRQMPSGATYPWLVRSTAMVNHFYVYCFDRDFGPFFIKFCTYFPYNAKLCLNGHEWLKRQLAQKGVAFEALDNGLLSCADPAQAQNMADSLSAEMIDALLRKWLAKLPHPFTPADRAAGYRYQISMLQSEFSLTQVLDRPLCGRKFFEEVIRENLDIGRPSNVQLIFDRRVTRRTPGQFRTRVITDGVIPSLHVDYKHSHIKQYHKEGRALRTETTINNTRDFSVGKLLCNLPALRQVGFAANRRLLTVQTVSHDCAIGMNAFEQVVQPIEVNGQHASALHFDNARAQALFQALTMFSLQPNGFANAQLRDAMIQLTGIAREDYSAGRMTYDLRRLRLHGIIERVAHSHRYQVTEAGLRVAMFFSRTYIRLLCPALSDVMPITPESGSILQKTFNNLQIYIDKIRGNNMKYTA